MIFSNSTLEEMRREAESTNNKLALAIFKKIENEDVEEERLLTRSERIQNELREYALNELEDSLVPFTINLLCSVYAAKGGKRKTLEAIEHFKVRCENEIGSDETEMLEKFINEVPKQLEQFVRK
jgi:hypothetical protein|nr:MAG TPA: hypothetical protein [Caudoviricetes sp.]